MKRTAALQALIFMTIGTFLAGCSQGSVKAAPLSPNYVAAQEALAADNFDL